MKVFLSSTKADLDEYREAVYEALSEQCEVVRMEDFPSAGDPPLAFCLGLVEAADVVVVLLGYRYGTRDPDAGLSYTEAEYEHARSYGKPVHGYIRTDFDVKVDASQQPEEDKRALRAFRQEIESAQVVRRPYFSGVAELAERVRFDLDLFRENGTMRPTFGRAVGSIRRAEGYRRESARRALIRAVPYPITLVNLSAIDLERYPGEAGGRLVRKLLDVEDQLSAKELTVWIFNDLEVLQTQSASVTEQRLAVAKRNSSLIICFAKSAEDIRRLEDFVDVQEKVVIWHPAGTELPDGFEPKFSRTYTPTDLEDCLLRIEAQRHALALATQRIYEELAA